MVALLVALAITGGLRELHVDRAADEAVERQEAVTQEALNTIVGNFERVLRDVQRRARSLAAEDRLVRGLQMETADERRDALTRYASTLRPPEHVGIEIYDEAAELRAWQGRTLLSEDESDVELAHRQHTDLIMDDGVRRAIAAWHPVRDEGEVVGGVRVLRLVEFQVPVRNRYMQGYSLADEWQRDVRYPVEVEWGTELEDVERGEARLLENDEGTALGRVVVHGPSAAQLVQQTADWFDDVMALWVTLLLLGAAGGGWRWYQAVERTPSGASAPYLKRATVRFLGGAVLWWGTRYLLIALDVPARWQTGSAPLAPLFDPTHLASGFGGGLMRSTGDLLITGLFAAGFAIALVHWASRFRVRASSWSELVDRINEQTPVVPSTVRFLGVLQGGLALCVGLILLLSEFVRHAVLDSTLDYFARTGLLPDPLVFTIFCALLLLTIAVVLGAVSTAWITVRFAVRYRPSWPHGGAVIVALLSVFAWLGGAYVLVDVPDQAAVVLLLAFVVTVGSVVVIGLIQQTRTVERFTLRSLVPAVILITILLYPLLYSGMDEQRRGRMVDAAQSFQQGEDPRVVFALEQVLHRARADTSLRAALRADPPEAAEQIDRSAVDLLRGSLAAALGDYETNLTVFGDARPIGDHHFTAAGVQVEREEASLDTRALYDDLQADYEGGLVVGPSVRQISDHRGRFQYAGIVPLFAEQEERPAAWIMAHAEPRHLLPGTGTAFPRVLLPEGPGGDLYADLALAEFRDGALVRSMGNFGRAQLSGSVRDALQEQSVLWHGEEVGDRMHLTYYHRGVAEEPDESSVVAVRIPAVMPFDHLYYLLRVAVAGLGIGLLIYLVGLVLRYRQGVLPAPRTRFRNKMLDAFFAVGVVSVVAVGLVGMQVVTQENERLVQDRLEQRLERVEETLLQEVRPGEPLYATAQRIGVDSLSARVGLDINLYEGHRLAATSRPRLVRDRLIDPLLPIAAYQSLYLDAERFTVTRERFGDLSYTVGYRALADEQGQPRYAISVPTLPEQERIEEEQARTLAYLFGALLVLVVVVMVTAIFLANALAQPIARLRKGLQAIGEGRYAQKLPVDTRDEIGELVETFNDMREQLAESRRKLAQQERELAWREMARQVAHEIKNPLTPMKLSVQHLRRAYDRLELPENSGASPDAQEGHDEKRKFSDAFDRITSTLIEQIDSLGRIADEFSTFARLPERVVEPIDLNEVAHEAADLMREETEDVEIQLSLDAEPLVVEADREELRRIYINLIKNGIQAIPDERDGFIDIVTTRIDGTEDEPDYVRSTVTDNGTGIPRDLREKIFQPNFSTKTSGTGLGLAIARKGIEEIGGTIGFDTQEGEGTTFWIHLPLSDEAM